MLPVPCLGWKQETDLYGPVDYLSREKIERLPCWLTLQEAKVEARRRGLALHDPAGNILAPAPAEPDRPHSS